MGKHRNEQGVALKIKGALLLLFIIMLCHCAQSFCAIAFKVPRCVESLFPMPLIADAVEIEKDLILETQNASRHSQEPWQ